LYGASRSEVLIQLIETLWLRFGPYMRMLTHHIEPLLKTDSAGAYSIHHREIVAALKGRDVAAARAAIVADIEATRDLLRGLIGEEQARTG
ncbi:MAG: FCD domain-containing protein, partial [Mesorhizobium sp.]